MQNLTANSFIAKCQSRNLKIRKDEICNDTCIILGDFAENYKVQGFHWNNMQATLHPIVIYYKDANNTLQRYSIFHFALFLTAILMISIWFIQFKKNYNSNEE